MSMYPLGNGINRIKLNYNIPLPFRWWSTGVKIMKTDLFRPLTTPEEARQYIQDLCDNGEIYHFDDDAEDVIWDGFTPTSEDIRQLDANRDRLFEVLEDPFEFVTLAD